MKKPIFLLGALLFALGAGYHLLALLQPLNHSPWVRNLVFTGLDLFCVYGFLRKPAYFPFFFFIFTIQQLISHGSGAWYGFKAAGTADWISLGVICVMPVLSFALIKRK